MDEQRLKKSEQDQIDGGHLCIVKTDGVHHHGSGAPMMVSKKRVLVHCDCTADIETIRIVGKVFIIASTDIFNQKFY